MQQLVQSLKARPWFLFGIPLFFVLHGFLENFGFIPVKDALLLAGIYCTGTLLAFLLFYLFYRHTIKAALMTAYTMAVYLFFGACHDFLLHHTPFLGKYSVFGSLLLLAFFVLLFRLKKRHSFQRPVLLLNLILLVCISYDLVLVTAREMNPPANKLGTMPPVLHYQPVTQAGKPDIWFLVFDEYASSVSLEQHYGFHNDLDTWLKEKGFSVQSNSYSNYSYTPASTASILNMSYISGLKDSMLMTATNMSYCLELIKNNEVIRFLSQQGYEIENLSPFDLAGNPAPMSETLLPLKTKLVTSNTLLSRMNRDFGWIFFKGPLGKWLDDPVQGALQINGALLQLLNERAAKKAGQPAFLYGHVYMPHGPFVFDRNGRLKDRKDIMNLDTTKIPAAYLDYLVYTNTQIKKLVSSIQEHSGGKAVIVLMGDHGFRYHGNQYRHENFQNLNAVYLPGGDYHLFYDSITCVNQFRVVFNSLFNQSIPLLKDSTIFLTSVP